MKVTYRKSDGNCLMSSSATTELCNTTETRTFIVTQLYCPEPNIITITAAVGVNIAEGMIISLSSLVGSFKILRFCSGLHMDAELKLCIFMNP